MTAFKFGKFAWPYGLRLDGASSQWLPFPLGDSKTTGEIISKFPVGTIVVAPVLVSNELKNVLFRYFRVVEKGSKFAFSPYGNGDCNEYIEISLYAISEVTGKSVEELEDLFNHTFSSLEIIG